MRKAFNPETEKDLEFLKTAYREAAIIIAQDIDNAPEEIRGFDSFSAADTYGQWCLHGDERVIGLTKPADYLASGSGGQTAFQDCVLGDNIWLWKMDER